MNSLRIGPLLIGSFLVLVLLLLAGPTRAQQKDQAKSCWSTATTQAAMNDCANKELTESEHKMFNLLGQLGISADDPAQKAWETYRNLQLQSIYPSNAAASRGAVYPMCRAILKKTLTDGRIRDLDRLKSHEGDVCWGVKPQARLDQGQPAVRSASSCAAEMAAAAKAAL